MNDTKEKNTHQSDSKEKDTHSSQSKEKYTHTSDSKTWFRTSDLAKLYGVTPATVIGWERNGKISAIKTPTGVRLFDKQSVLNNLSQVQTAQTTRHNIIYCRVSSKHQSDDLSRQIQFLKSKYPDYQLLQDVGSGINFRRPGLTTILEYAMSGDLGEVVVSYKDRIARFGFELIEWIITHNGGQLTVLDNTEHKSSEQELAEDLLSIITVFNCRQMGKRRYSCKKSQNTSDSIEEKPAPSTE